MKTNRTTPPRPVLFTKGNGPWEVLNFKVTKEEPCKIFSFDPSHKMFVSLQKIEDRHVVGQSLHSAKVSKIYDLGSSGLSVTFEVNDNWKLSSTVFMNRQSMEELRDRLTEFLG